MMKVAVFGSGSASRLREAEEIGFLLAEAGATVLTGGCGGVPGAAARAAKSRGAEVVAYSPGRDLDEHRRMGMQDCGHTGYVFVDRSYPHAGNAAVCLKHRNVMSCADADACIIVEGRIGTLNEFTNMHDMGKAIGVLLGSGGCADMVREITGAIGKKTSARIVYDNVPRSLVRRVVNAAKR